MTMPNPQTPAKEPWQMTSNEYVSTRYRPGYPPENPQQAMRNTHRQFVCQAILAGRPVPPEVLLEYPDLAASCSAPRPQPRPMFDIKPPDIKPFEPLVIHPLYITGLSGEPTVPPAALQPPPLPGTTPPQTQDPYAQEPGTTLPAMPLPGDETIFSSFEHDMSPEPAPGAAGPSWLQRLKKPKTYRHINVTPGTTITLSTKGQ